MLNKIHPLKQLPIFIKSARTGLLHISVGLLSALSLISCASTPLYTAPIKETDMHKMKEPTIYKSKDYVIYNLEENLTPEELAGRFLGDPKRAWVVEEANPDNNFTKGQVVIIPLKDRNKGGLTAEGYQTIPVLCYHKFAEDCESNLCMPAKVFDQQMRYLKDNGYRTIGPEDLIAFLEYRKSLPKKSVWITMDDGYRSVYDIAYPILKKYGFTATFFVYIDFVGVPKTAVSWNHLRQMKEDGFAIGSHTVFHSDLTKKKEAESEEDFITRIKNELNDSKRIIDQKLNQDTLWLAYPYGKYDQRVMKLSREAGYKLAVSVKRGGNPFFENPFSLKRDQILSRDLNKFASRLKIFNHLPLE